MLVLGSSDARTRTIGELLEISGETLLPETRLGYTEPRGEPSLRDAIARHHQRSREQVLVTVGASEAIFLILHSILTTGDHALVCAPGYQSIAEMARHAGATVETYDYPEADAFRPDGNAIAARITRAAQPFACVFLNSPHNPTGRILTIAALQTILEAAAVIGTRVIVDEVMSGIFAADSERTPSVSLLSPDAIVIGNVSKSFGLGGLRVGWIVAPSDVIDHCTQWRYYTSISPPVIVQQLARIALEHGTAILAENEESVRANHGILSSWAARHNSALRLLPWEGGTVVLMKLLTGEADESFSRRLADSARVFVVPGSTFDLPGYLRVGLGLPPENFSRALERIEPFLVPGGR